MIKTAQDMKSYKKQLKEALADKFLRSALDNFNTAYRENRSAVYYGIDFEGLKNEIAAGKDSALPHLIELFEEFKAKAEAVGAKVHTAKDARQANQIIAAIAKENHVKKIIKAKSMTAEETFLNDHLEKEGFTVTETDLGEWIIQLRGEGPSHMVMPAIHLSRYQVGDLFAKVTREKQESENIDKLVKVARKQLRPAYLEADMGISGANFAIAESGALGLVTNEGNMRKAYLAQKPLAGKEPMIRHLPHFIGKEHRFRSVPVISKTPLRDQWQQIRMQVTDPKYNIAFFVGCAIDFIYPEQARALLTLLKGRGVQVVFPMDQSCCGLPLLAAAEEETAKDVALQNLRAMHSESYDYILTLCASCGSHLKHNYLKMFKSDPDAPANLKQFTDKIIDFSSFMANVLDISAKEFKAAPQKVAYHSPCHLCRGLQVTVEPRRLIEIAGYEYVPSKDEDVCCGFGGSYSVDFPEISAEILKKKLDNVQDSDARLLVTDCPGCVIQLRGGMDKRKTKIQVKHIAEVLAEALK